MKVITKGPLFSSSRPVKAKASMGAAMKGCMIEGERLIKLGYTASPAPNVVGGRKTSHLSRGIRGKVFNPYRGVIAAGRFVYGSDVPYAYIVENGRSASNQTIKPRRAKALRFKPRGSNRFVYRKTTKPFKRPLKGNPMFKKVSTDPKYYAKCIALFNKLYGKAIGANKI